MSIKGTGKFSDVRMARLMFVLSSVPIDEATVSVEAGSATEGGRGCRSRRGCRRRSARM